MSTEEGSKAPRAEQVAVDDEPPIPIYVSSHIIEQYARHLYTNPRKAVEELACNSYDAGATHCHIRTPRGSEEPLIVLDNGGSMDHAGLQALWRVGESPKASDPVHRTEASRNRHVIGKFGVGKLAAFALGSKLTHFVHKGGVTRKLTVDLNEIKRREHGTSGTQEGPIAFPVHILTPEETEAYLDSHLDHMPKPWKEGWETWTVALVEEIDVEGAIKSLEHGILRTMIATALPIHGEFVVMLNREQVPRPGLDGLNLIGVHKLIEEDVRSRIEAALRAGWCQLLKIPRDEVPEGHYRISTSTMADPHNATKQIDCISVPGIGEVAGFIICSHDTLTKEKASERGYANHGYFVRVHDKLLNPLDNQFGRDRPQSYQSWNRCQINIEVPELDRDVLVNRNDVDTKDERPDLVRWLLNGCFNFARSRIDPMLEASRDWAPTALFTRIAQHSPRTQDALLAGFALDGTAVAIEELAVEAVDSSESFLTAYNPATAKIEVNVNHPLCAALKLKSDTGPSKAIRELVAGGELVCSLLRGRSVDSQIVDDVTELWNTIARAAVGHVRDVLEHVIKDLHDAHTSGDRPFEMAICNAFDALGLAAKQIGGTGEPDGRLKIIIPGEANVLVAVEAKGGLTKVDHKRVDVATLNEHRKMHGCQAAIVVGRADLIRRGRADDEESWTQLVRNCKNNSPPALIFPFERITQMLRLHTEHPFTRDQIRSLLTTWRHPDDLEEAIQREWDGRTISESQDLSSIEELLELIDKLSDEKSKDKPAHSAINARGPVSEWNLSDDDLWHLILSIHRFCRGGLMVSAEEKRCWLSYQPALVLEQYQKNLRRHATPAE